MSHQYRLFTRKQERASRAKQRRRHRFGPDSDPALWGPEHEPIDVGFMTEKERELIQTRGSWALTRLGVFPAPYVAVLEEELGSMRRIPEVKAGDHATALYIHSRLLRVKNISPTDGGWIRERGNLHTLTEKWRRRAFGEDAVFEIRGTRRGRPTLEEQRQIAELHEEIKARIETAEWRAEREKEQGKFRWKEKKK